jgi:predicted RNA-binding Zn ribbon-like protein
VRRLSSTPRPQRPPADHPDADPEAAAPKGLPRTAGLHRVVWDLRWDGAELIPGAMIDWGDPEVGPLALPGRYTARLRAGQDASEAEVTIEPDPDLRDVTAADLEAQLEFALELRAAITRLTRDVVRLRAVRAQLAERAAFLGSAPAGAAGRGIAEQATALARRLDGIEARLHNPAARVSYDILAGPDGARLYSRLSPLFSFAIEGDGAPTQGLREVYAGQASELEALEKELGEALGAPVQELNRRAAEAGLGLVNLP